MFQNTIIAVIHHSEGKMFNDRAVSLLHNANLANTVETQFLWVRYAFGCLSEFPSMIRHLIMGVFFHSTAIWNFVAVETV